jgi:hypothetical protein
VGIVVWCGHTNTLEMVQKHFIQLRLVNKNTMAQVSTQGCSNVADYKDGIKNKFSPTLDSYASYQLTLLQPDGITEIDPQTSVDDLKEIPWKPMVVTVEESPIQFPTGSSKKQLTYYNGLGVEASCRKFFDALARKLALYYRFQWGPEDENDYPTFGDVLYAYKNNAWNFINRQQSYAERTDESGFTQVAAPVPILSITTNEWAKLKEWNQKINNRVHDADLPRTSTGKYFVIIPHADYNEENVSFFKTIGVKGRLYNNASKLEVKDEDDLLSGSSSSKSGSPDKDKKL